MAPRRVTRARPGAPNPLILRWDLDKTYLKTEFDSVRQLVRIPFEKPQDKVAVPGAVALIRGLRETAAHAGRTVQVYFISASPPQIAKAVKEKLALDGIEYDGIVFKNQWQHIVRGRFRNLREQVGYKLTELLASRRDTPVTADEILFGDDWESDPLIYSLYADVVAGRVDRDQLIDVLTVIGVDTRLIERAVELAGSVPRSDGIRRIYINLERRTPPTNFHAFGPRLVPTFNYLQAAACLFEDGYLTLPAVAAVAEHLISAGGSTPERLANALADVRRRGHLARTSAIAVREYLHARGLLPRRRHSAVQRSWWERLWPWEQLRQWVRLLTETPPPAAPTAIDYRALVTDWRAGR